MKKLTTLLIAIVALSLSATAQVQSPVKWTITQKKISEGVYDIICKAKIDKNWHLYDSKLPKGGPLPTSFNLDTEESSNVELVGEFKATTTPLEEKSEAFNMMLRYFSNEATFIQRVKVTGNKARLTGYIEFMACSGSQCIPPGEQDFDIELTK